MNNPGTGTSLQQFVPRFFGWHLILWPMVSLTIMAIGALFIMRIPNIDQYIVWLATTVGIIFFATIILLVADRRLADSVRETEDKYIETYHKIENDVRQFMEPAVNFQESPSVLRMSMASIFDSFYESSDTNDREIHILGADLLAPTRDRLEELKEKSGTLTEDEKSELAFGNSYYTIFQQASDKEVRRYIRLFLEDEITGRTKDFKVRYENWLDAQATFIRTMSNYALIDTPRAPAWGAPKSTMILGTVMAEIFFTPAGPTGGIILVSNKIVPATQKKLIDEYVNAPDVKPEPMHLYTKGNIDDFIDYIERIKKAIRKPKKRSK